MVSITCLARTLYQYYIFVSLCFYMLLLACLAWVEAGVGRNEWRKSWITNCMLRLVNCLFKPCMTLRLRSISPRNPAMASSPSAAILFSEDVSQK
jgi:hypothetical protein